MKPNRVLFIPVSSPSGIGEYMRSLIIAKALKQRWPDINITFVLNERVSYLKDCPFKVHACDGSPTKNVKRVNEVIRQVNPDLVVFDASGRASQFAQAKKTGAKVAFISQHNKKRSRGLKLNRLLKTDIHWVAQPSYCLKDLSGWQKLKLSIFNKKAPQNIGPVFESPCTSKSQALSNELALKDSDFYLFNAGSGGHMVVSELAADIYYQAAKELYHKTKCRSIVVFGSNYPKPLPQDNNITCLKHVDTEDFISLVNTANICVISAGDTLLQGISLKKRCVAAPVSPDQPARLKLCQQEGLVLAAQPTVESIIEQVMYLTDSEGEASKALIKNLNNQKTANALSTIIDDIKGLFVCDEN